MLVDAEAIPGSESLQLVELQWVATLSSSKVLTLARGAYKDSPYAWAGPNKAISRGLATRIEKCSAGEVVATFAVRLSKTAPQLQALEAARPAGQAARILTVKPKFTFHCAAASSSAHAKFELSDLGDTRLLTAIRELQHGVPMTVELGRDDTSTRRHLVRAVFLAYQCPDDIRELGRARGRPGPLRIEVTRRDDDGYDYDVKVVGMGRIFSPKVLRDFQKLRLRATRWASRRHAARCLINPMMFVGLFGGLAPFREEGAVDEFLARGERHEGVVDDAAAAWGEALAAERRLAGGRRPGAQAPHLQPLAG
ncbi:hypothetical protein JL720_11593 [Aureococcus anophagefferens]|nr:hypothetical protein JL720_11593 [Aureococcus anophagefferens]